METLLGYPVRTSVVHPGDKIDGRYHILSVIADGGMGTVFLAEHMLIKRRVALKVLHPELASDIAMVNRFMNEASAAGSLGHPNIVESTDMGFTASRVPAWSISLVIPARLNTTLRAMRTSTIISSIKRSMISC